VLFLPDSNGAEAELPGEGGKEDKLDGSTSFSEKHISSRTLAGSGLQSPFKFGGRESVTSYSFMQEPSRNPNPRPAVRTLVQPKAISLGFEDELADLEAWLDSDAVQII
jgi:hypothetical protein